MITPETKHLAIARLKMAVPIKEISEDLGVPIPLIKEWEKGMDSKDLVQLNANVHAVNYLAKNILIASTENNTKLLQAKLEECAIQLSGEVLNIDQGDIVTARTLQLLADTVSKLYLTFISKPSANKVEEINDMTMFESLRRD